MGRKPTLKQQEKIILEKAAKKGIQNNYFFVTTFNRYKMQLKIMDDLEKEINEAGPLITKEYVKGRGNVYTHPAITEYNKTASAANGTVTTLLKIIQSLPDEGSPDSKLERMAEIFGDD